MESVSNDHFIYVCFHLKNEALTDPCRKRLESRGVECLEQGGPHEAYGIVGLSSDRLNRLFTDPEISWVETREPPNCI